jgi:Trp operon repressor
MDWDQVCRRAGGRRKYLALQRERAIMRRKKMVELLGRTGFGHGAQAELARLLGVSAATICRDMKAINIHYTKCQYCGELTERDVN